MRLIQINATQSQNETFINVDAIAWFGPSSENPAVTLIAFVGAGNAHDENTLEVDLTPQQLIHKIRHESLTLTNQ